MSCRSGQWAHLWCFFHLYTCYMLTLYRAIYGKSRKLLWDIFTSLKHIKIKKRKHLEKINDFFLHLFRSSCNQITIDHEVAYKYGDFKNLCMTVNDKVDNLYVHKFIADAQIRLSHTGNKFNIVLEQDNGTERIDILKAKISNYFNFILHQNLITSDINIFVFRVDMELTNFQLKKCQRMLDKEDSVTKDNLKQLTNLYKEVKQSDDVTIFFEVAKKLKVKEDFSKKVFLNNISREKVWIERGASIAKNLFYNGYKAKINSHRLEDIKNLLVGEVAVEKFYDTGDNSVFFDITGHSVYSSTDSRIDIQKIMLRTNFVYGDNRIEYYLFYYLFNEYDFLKGCIESYLSDNGYSNIKIDTINKKQKVIKLGDETVCFDFATTININDKYIDFIILYPNIFISDLAKIKYIASLNNDLIDSCLNNYTVFFVYQDKNAYDIAMIHLEYKECKKAKFYINMIDDKNIWTGPIVFH